MFYSRIRIIELISKSVHPRNFWIYGVFFAILLYEHVDFKNYELHITLSNYTITKVR